jgi:hypothetical protein
MLVDVLGKINNMKLAKSNALLPLFEAVINSLQAIRRLSRQLSCNFFTYELMV